MEHKTLALVEAKAALDGDGPGEFEGLASAFGQIDSYADTIDAGAYAETIPAFLRDGFIAWSHDWQQPIATPLSAREEPRGLFLTAEFHTHAAAQQARAITAERLQRGKTMGISIGYEALAWEMRQVETPVRNRWGEFTDKIRALTKIRLIECSLVMLPADSGAHVTSAKSSPQPFDAHSDDVRVAVAEWLARVKAGSAIREADLKVGRAISEARRTRMQTVSGSLRDAAAEIDAMLKETEPEKEPKAAASVDLLRQRFLHDRAAARRALQWGVSA